MRGELPASSATALSRLAAQGRSVFTVDEFASALGRPRSRVWRILTQLVARGWVARVTKGKYLIVPLEAGPESAWTEDSLVVACHLADPAAIAYWTACHYWNWTEQVPRTVFVQTTRRKRHYHQKALGVAFRFVCVDGDKFFGTAERTAGRGRFTVTDREKTLVDALDRPDLCGGMGLVFEMLPAAAETVRWDKVEAYVERMGSGALYKRLGFLVETLGEKVMVPERESRLEAWHARLTGGHSPLEPGGPPDGPVDSRWRLRVNVPALARSMRSS